MALERSLVACDAILVRICNACPVRGFSPGVGGACQGEGSSNNGREDRRLEENAEGDYRICMNLVGYQISLTRVLIVCRTTGDISCRRAV